METQKLKETTLFSVVSSNVEEKRLILHATLDSFQKNLDRTSCTFEPVARTQAVQLEETLQKEAERRVSELELQNSSLQNRLKEKDKENYELQQHQDQLMARIKELETGLHAEKEKQTLVEEATSSDRNKNEKFREMQREIEDLESRNTELTRLHDETVNQLNLKIQYLEKEQEIARGDKNQELRASNEESENQLHSKIKELEEDLKKARQCQNVQTQAGSISRGKSKTHSRNPVTKISHQNTARREQTSKGSLQTQELQATSKQGPYKKEKQKNEDLLKELKKKEEECETLTKKSMSNLHYPGSQKEPVSNGKTRSICQCEKSFLELEELKKTQNQLQEQLKRAENAHSFTKTSWNTFIMNVKKSWTIITGYERVKTSTS
ncbi:hypothetical protein WMY93_026860 [Mugilogobius chulae]|uniref:Uncharacterized protein n=1 Tax=Mugilogobius chulae TaxID=88201 RepID=A0AAW0N245_9GOBI